MGAILVFKFDIVSVHRFPPGLGVSVSFKFNENGSPNQMKEINWPDSSGEWKGGSAAQVLFTGVGMDEWFQCAGSIAMQCDTDNQSQECAWDIAAGDTTAAVSSHRSECHRIAFPWLPASRQPVPQL
jgi:hypothetical protein